MADEGFKRKLAAILSSDVEGYSRLMDDNEEATVRTITSYRNVISNLTQQFRGRVVDSPGDNILADFTSVVDAVNCAVEIQRDLAERNAELPDSRKMQFRIGVNLGDVIDEDGRLYGDGVNIAARVESLATAGGICISGRAHDQVENKLGLEYEDLGKHEVKNISRPIQVYRVLSYPGAAAHRVVQAKESLGKKWRKIAVSAAVVVVIAVGLGIWQFYMRRPTIEPASVEKMAHPLPDKPSIAVLPFDNMSGDPAQEFFSDGITEDIITALSKTYSLFVIARNSTFVYKDKPTSVKQIAEELGVRYVLEGSVRKSEDHVRINAQLIDAVKGTHLWAERYDRDLKDLFALQDEITLKIVTALQIKLTEGEQARLLGEKIGNIDLKMKHMELQSLFRKGTSESYIRFGQLAQKLIDMAPESPYGYIALAGHYWRLVYLGKSKSPQNSTKKAFELTQKAISLDDTVPDSHILLSSIYLVMRQHDKAIAEGERAVALDPNGAFAHHCLSLALCYADRVDEGIDHIKQAIRLNPFPAYFYYMALSRGYRMKGQYEEALAEIKKATQLAPNWWGNYLMMSIIYSLMDRQEEAAAAAKKILELDPNFSVERNAKAMPYKNPAEIKIINDACLKAGLPYTPPLPLPDKPSIAVLAFDNMSDDPEQEYFSDGLSEEIISALAKTDQLFVIARNSSFTYKGKPVDVKQISRELGVRYVLEGSVRKSGDRVRVTAQLIDATTGHHLWSERYDRDLKDIFALQDEITLQIVNALQIELTDGEEARMWGEKYKNLDVYLKFLEAASHFEKGTLEGNMRHGKIAQEIIDMAPELPVGYRSLGWHYWVLAGLGKSPGENLKRAFELAQKALSLDESDAYSHALLGAVYSMMRQHEKAIAEGERSIELGPNGARYYLLLGQTLSYVGRSDEAIEHLKKGIRLNPFPNYMYFYHLGRCYFQKGQYEEALTEIKKALQLAPESPPLHFHLALTYILLNREEEARASAAKCIELAPFVTVAWISKVSREENQALRILILDAMRKAGFPEGT